MIATSLLVSSLLAMGPRWAAAEEADSPQYRGLLSEAVAEYDARRYEEARALFRRAHDLSPNARTLRGIGMASFELREYVDALRALEGALAETRKPLTAPQRQQVEGLLERTRAFVGRFIPHVTPKDAIIRVDGAPVSLETDGTLLLSFGRHAVTAEAPGYTLESRELNVIGGERQELTFRLHVAVPEIPPELPPAAQPSPAQPPPVSVKQEVKPSGSSGTGWFIGAGVLAAGAVAGAMWWRNRSGEIDRCAEAQKNGSVCGNGDELASQRRLAIGLTAGLGVGALALGIIGTVISAGGHGASPGGTGTTIACNVGGSGDPVGCAIRVSF